MSINRFFISAIAVVALFVLTSCQSYEKRVINKLNNLSERIEKNGKDFDADDWEEAVEELADIHEDMKDCEFTKEELKELGRKEGKLAATIAKEGTKALGKGVADYLGGLGSFAKGFKEGAEDNFSEEDIKDVSEEIESALKSIEEDWKE